MKPEEIRIYGADLTRNPSSAVVLIILATIGVGIPLYLILTEDLSFISLLIAVVLLLALVTLWAWYNENHALFLSQNKIHLARRLLTHKYKTVTSVDLDNVKELRITRIVHFKMAPKSLFTFAHHDGQVTEKWVGLVMDKSQEIQLRDKLSIKGIAILFEE